MKIQFDRDVDQFPVFEAVLKKRGRGWRWHVCTTEGKVVMQGSESIRPAAKYKADRALFLLLLSAPYRSIDPAAQSRERRLHPCICSFHRHGVNRVNGVGRTPLQLLKRSQVNLRAP